jgi:hypothetical protein
MVCIDEKSRCQALERSQPILPMRSGIPERQSPAQAPTARLCSRHSGCASACWRATIGPNFDRALVDDA